MKWGIAVGKMRVGRRRAAQVRQVGRGWKSEGRVGRAAKVVERLRVAEM